MNESERRQESIQEQKAKIRRRYQGIAPEKVRIIPVTVLQPDFDDDTTPKRVAVYARVSTGDPRQTSSYELQKNYYESQVEKHSNWTLVSIYADESIILGTSQEVLATQGFPGLILIFIWPEICGPPGRMITKCAKSSQ